MALGRFAGNMSVVIPSHSLELAWCSIHTHGQAVGHSWVGRVHGGTPGWWSGIWE